MDVMVGSDGNCHSTAMLIIQTMFFSLSSISSPLFFLSFPLSFSLCLSLDARACTHTHWKQSLLSLSYYKQNISSALCCHTFSPTTLPASPPSIPSLALSPAVFLSFCVISSSIHSPMWYVFFEIRLLQIGQWAGDADDYTQRRARSFRSTARESWRSWWSWVIYLQAKMRNMVSTCEGIFRVGLEIPLRRNLFL